MKYHYNYDIQYTLCYIHIQTNPSLLADQAERLRAPNAKLVIWAV